MYSLIFIIILCLVPLNFIIIDRFYVICSLYFLSAILTLLCGFRAIGVDKDSFNYFLMFNMFNNYLDSLSVGVEPGFSVLTTLLKKIGLDSINYLFLIFALLSVPIKIKFIYKYSKYPILSILIFYSFMYFKQDFTQIRAALAIAIYIWAIDDIIHKRFKLFILKIICASLFHVSAMVLFFTYFISNNEINRCKYLLVLCSVFIAANLKLTNILLKLPFLSTFVRLQSYVEKSSDGSTSVFNPLGALFLLQFIISLLLIYFIDTIKNKDCYSILFVKLLVCGTICLYAFGGLSATVATRINELLAFSMCISYAYFIHFIKPILAAITIVVFIGCILYWFQMFYDPIMMPYHSWL